MTDLIDGVRAPTRPRINKAKLDADLMIVQGVLDRATVCLGASQERPDILERLTEALQNVHKARYLLRQVAHNAGGS